MPIFPKTFYEALSMFLENLKLEQEWVDEVHICL